MTPYDLLVDIHALEEEMLAFERKYGIRSETFYAAYVTGEEPETIVGCWILASGPASIARGWSVSPSIETPSSKCSGGSPAFPV